MKDYTKAVGTPRLLLRNSSSPQTWCLLWLSLLWTRWSQMSAAQDQCWQVWLVREAFLTFVFELVCSFRSLVLQVLHHVVNLGLVFQEEWSNDTIVDEDRSVWGSGGHTPHQEGTLEHETALTSHTLLLGNKLVTPNWSRWSWPVSPKEY